MPNGGIHGDYDLVGSDASYYRQFSYAAIRHIQNILRMRDSGKYSTENLTEAMNDAEAWLNKERERKLRWSYSNAVQEAERQ